MSGFHFTSSSLIITSLNWNFQNLKHINDLNQLYPRFSKNGISPSVGLLCPFDISCHCLSISFWCQLGISGSSFTFLPEISQFFQGFLVLFNGETVCRNKILDSPTVSWCCFQALFIIICMYSSMSINMSSCLQTMSLC